MIVQLKKPEPETLGFRIKQLREAQGLNQGAFAALLNRPQGTVSAWESNKVQPDLSNAVLIAKTLTVSLDWLLGITTHQPTGDDEAANVPDPSARDAGVTYLTDRILVWERLHIRKETWDALEPWLSPLAAIYEAQGHKDPEVAQAWGWILGNIRMFIRGIGKPPPKRKPKRPEPGILEVGQQGRAAGLN